MAVNFAPTNTFVPFSSTYHPDSAYPQQTTPFSSANATPTNISPASPRTASTGSFSSITNTLPSHLSFQSRQLRPPKSPLYVPAVLRPTERPSRYGPSRPSSSSTKFGSAYHSRTNSSATTKVGSPLTPPLSAGGSFDNSGHTDKGGDVALSWVDEEGKNGIVRVVTDEWSEDALENVTGAPTRDHWKPDPLSLTCDYTPPTPPYITPSSSYASTSTISANFTTPSTSPSTSTSCTTAFSFINRRHHCRRCGNIFCAAHSADLVPLDQHARFHPKGFWERSCAVCYRDYKTWDRMMKRRGSAGGSEGKSSGTATPVPGTVTGRGAEGRVAEGRAAGAVEGKIKEGQGKKKGKEMVVGSVPRDWHWSTF